MAIHVQIDPLERTATLRGVHSLCAGESSEVIVSGVPDADTPTLSLRVYRDSSESVQVACSVRPGTDPAEEGLVPVEGRAALRRGTLDLRTSAVSEWASGDAAASAAAEEARRSGSREPEARAAASYRHPDSAWLVVADSSRVWAACAVPFVLRPFDDALSPDPSYAERAEAAAEAAERSASAASASALEASQAAARAEAATSGKADLVDGKVPASQLPSYVDDVLEVAELPASGEPGKLYVVTGTNAVYRWSGSGFVEVSPSRDWSGELAAKRDRTDLSVDPGEWLLVKPDGTQAWLGKPDPQQDTWIGDGFALACETAEAYWALTKVDESSGVLVVDDSYDSPPDANKLTFLGTDATSVYRLVRGSRFALDTEIPPAQVNADWNATGGVAEILNKPTIPTVPTPVAPSTDASAQGKPADAKATGVLIISGLEFDPEDQEYEVGQIVLYEGKLYRCVNPHSGPWNSGDFRETSIGAVLNYLALFKYTKPDGGIPASDLSQAVETALSAIPGKADAADLRYRIAEAAVRKTLPADCFPVTFTYDGVSYSINSLVKEGEASAAGDMFIMVDENDYSLAVVESPATGSEQMGAIEVATFDAGGVFETSGIQDLQFGGVSPVASASPTMADIQVLADRTVNLITASDETSVDIELPEAVTVDGVRRARDFFLDIDNSANASDLALEFTGLGVDYAFVPLEDDSISEMMTIGSGKRVRLYFSETPYTTTGSLPVINVARVTLGDFVTSTTPQGGN